MQNCFQLIQGMSQEGKGYKVATSSQNPTQVKCQAAEGVLIGILSGFSYTLRLTLS